MLNMFTVPTRFAFTVPYGGDQPVMLVPPWTPIGGDPTVVDAAKSNEQDDNFVNDIPTTPTSGSSNTMSARRRSSRLIARSVQSTDSSVPQTPSTRKGPSSNRATSSEKSPAVPHAATSSKPPSSMRVGPQRTEKESGQRFVPYQDYRRLSRKFKNVDQWTLWWPISSKKLLVAPPKEINNPAVNDLCINTVEGSKRRQFWIFTEEHQWESINVGDIRTIGDKRRKLVVNQKGCPDWVRKVGGQVQEHVPVDEASLSSAGPSGSPSTSNESRTAA